MLEFLVTHENKNVVLDMVFQIHIDIALGFLTSLVFLQLIFSPYLSLYNSYLFC